MSLFCCQGCYGEPPAHCVPGAILPCPSGDHDILWSSTPTVGSLPPEEYSEAAKYCYSPKRCQDSETRQQPKHICFVSTESMSAPQWSSVKYTVYERATMVFNEWNWSSKHWFSPETCVKRQIALVVLCCNVSDLNCFCFVCMCVFGYAALIIWTRIWPRQKAYTDSQSRVPERAYWVCWGRAANASRTRRIKERTLMDSTGKEGI